MACLFTGGRKQMLLNALGAAAVAGFALASAPAAAQPAPLDLHEALQLAARNNETAAVAAARLDRADATLREAKAALLPVLAATASYTRRSTEVTRQFGDTQAVIQSENALGAAATLDLTVVDAPAWTRLRRTELAVQAQRLEAGELRRDLGFAVAEAYFAVLAAERQAEAAARRAEVARTSVDEMRKRLGGGLGTRGDVTRAELELAAADLAVVRARGLVRNTRLSLGYLLGVEADRPLVEPPETPVPAQEAAPLTQQALATRPDLAARQLQADAARAGAREPWMRLVPTLGVRATVRGTNETGLSGRAGDWNVAATLSWVLFDGGVRYAQAAARNAEVREASLAADALRRRIALEIRTAQENLDTAAASVERAAVAARVAGENARDVRERGDHGLATALERADAAVAEFEAQSELARQRFALRVSQLALVRSLGRWPDGETKK